MSILVTGGAGYIGSHTTVELLENGYDVIIADNLSNSSEDVIERIQEMTKKKVTAYNVDLLDKDALEYIFKQHDVEAVMHFAGFKAVGESIELPLKYYANNVTCTVNLCRMMAKFSVYKLIFSSSATVYGMPETLPVTEDAPTEALNPYGKTKLMCENILSDLAASNPKWQIESLRYFNPVGAHPSGKIGENPNGIPNNLMPFITQVATGQLEKVNVFGSDYPTKDGTGVRDYIHVVDLAKGHMAALKHIEETSGWDTINLGTGQGYSVLEVIKTFKKASGVNIPYDISSRREGDAAEIYADCQKASVRLGWQAEKELYDMCKHAWEWESNKHLSKVY